MTSLDHLVPLPSACGTWFAWRWAALRCAGFPASWVLRAGAPDSAAAADRLLDAEQEIGRARARTFDALRRLQVDAGRDDAVVEKALKTARKGRVPDDTNTTADDAIRALRQATAEAEAARTALAEALTRDGARTSLALHDVASNPTFREALAWQNRAALSTAIAPLLRHSATGPGASRHRRHEELVANYLQRYCTKNDTIGFFGPVGWARLDAGPTGIVVTPGPTLLSHRSVHFEQWPIDELAKKLAADPRLEPWMCPRRFPFVRAGGTSVRSAVNGKHELTPEQAALLAECSGERTARQLATHLTRERPDLFSSETQIFELLRVLREKLLVAWTLEVPLEWNPNAALRRLLGRIDDEALRAEITSPLDELEQARTRVAEATGNVDALEAALSDLDATFTRVTALSPTRNAGAMYAGRSLVFEDCCRDLDVTVGQNVLSSVGPALSLVLASARWVTFEIARVFRERFRAIYADVVKRSRSATVSFDEVWFRVQRLLVGEKQSPLVQINAELARRWGELLAFEPGTRRVQVTSAALAPRVAQVFAAARPGWYAAKHHSPDIMISAPSVEAIQRGDYQAVLGEIHVGANTLDSVCLLEQHPSPDDLVTAHGRDFPELLTMPVYSKEWLKITARTNRAFTQTWHRFVESGFDVAPGPREQALALSELTVEEVDGEILVRGPDEFRLELLELLGEAMSQISSSGFQMLPRADHAPRITIDQLVVSRETWRVMPSTMAFAFEEDRTARFVAARRWARSLGLPRFLYAKSTIEVKPVYIDLDSPIFVNMFAKLVRRTKEHALGETAIMISEMLPGLHETWVPDADGERYTSELRIVVVDGE